MFLGFRRAFARGHGRAFHRGAGGGPAGGPGGGRGFGVRRPLRFLIDALGLDDAQAAEVARVFQALRLERESAQLDGRRARARIAELVEAAGLDAAALGEAAEVRVTAARRERDAVVDAVRRLHGTLDAGQRRALATLLRTGPIDL